MNNGPIKLDCGKDIYTFDEKELLNNYEIIIFMIFKAQLGHLI